MLPPLLFLDFNPVINYRDKISQRSIRLVLCFHYDISCGSFSVCLIFLDQVENFFLESSLSVNGFGFVKMQCCYLLRYTVNSIQFHVVFLIYCCEFH